MDCRVTFVLAFGLATGGLGCASQAKLPLVANNDKPAEGTPKPHDQSPRQPMASTCIACGEFCEKNAADPRHSPAEKERLLDQARKAYQQALEREPNNLAAFEALARLYTTLGDHAHAVATYEKAVQAHPEKASAWFELGMCHARSKEWEPALDNLRHAVELDPEDRTYNHFYGFCLARAGRYEESLAVFARVEEEGIAHYDLACMLHHMNEDELSKQHLRTALEKKPDLNPARQLLAALETPAGDSKKLIQTSSPDALEDDSDLQQPALPSPGSPSSAGTPKSSS
ncbi:MAG TPA: tetratricopeptide repeat protein [Gemmataceae bacterium]|nr:tetratricopeptide repeat protein [Gemmataceae bacterium]